MNHETVVDHIGITVGDITDKFIETGERTPAGGLSYIHQTLDMCATVYRDTAKIFFNRRKGFDGHQKRPYIYKNTAVCTDR